MRKVKSAKFLVLVFIFACIFTVTAIKLFGQQTAGFSGVSFSSSGGILRFFDSATGKLYSYSSSSGQLNKIWFLKKLGDNLETGYRDIEAY